MNRRIKYFIVLVISLLFTMNVNALEKPLSTISANKVYNLSSGISFNWNEVAYKRGKEYKKYYPSFIKQQMINQLNYEKFTTAEVNYAIAKLGF